ncbi:MAG: hypothetical protein ACK5Q5_10170, partial [Planctomycetaceae bacterium]
STKPEMELLTSVVNRQLITIDEGYLHRDAWLTYEILRGKLDTVMLAVPTGERVLDVSGDVGIKGWKVEDEVGRQGLKVELIAPAEGEFTIEVHTERVAGDAVDPIAGQGDANATFGIHAIDAVRESGQVAVKVGDGLELTVTDQQGLPRIAANDVDPRLKSATATAFKFYSGQYKLGVHAQPIEPRVIVTQSTQLIFDDDELRLIAALAYQIERAGVFELKLKVPDDLTIDDVQSEQMQSESFDATSRVLTVKLQKSTQGNVGLSIRAHRSLAAGQENAEQDLPVLEPLEPTRETGTVAVYAPPGVEIVANEAALQSVQPSPLVDVQPRGEARLQAAWSYSRRPVRIAVSTSRKPTRLSATIATAVDLQPETIEAVTTLNYLVEFAGVDTFRFLVPEAVSGNVQIEAVNTDRGGVEIKQKTAGPAENGWVPWTVVMQRKVVGSQGLRVTYRITREGNADATAESDAAAADRQSTIQLIRPQGKPETANGSAAVPLTQLKGEVRISKERSLSVQSDAAGGDIEAIDLRELTLLPTEGAAAYRYFRQPDDAAIELQLTQTKHEIREVTPTVVERGLVEIATAWDARTTYRAQFQIKTTERQRLRIDLPKELEVLGIFVDGAEEKLNPLTEGVSPRDDVEAFTVNISRRQQSDQAFILTLQFNWNVNPPPFEAPFVRGEIHFPLPRIGGTETPAPVQQLQTVVYVPDGFWLVGRPDRFDVLGERNWWDGLTGRPQPIAGETNNGFSSPVAAPLDFPTQGLTATRYQNLGGAPEIDVVWWDITNMSIVLSIALAIVAFLLLNTHWENKLGVLLLIAFVALLFGTKDRDALSHGLAAARYGLLFLVLLWLLHAAFGRRSRSAASAPTAPPSGPVSYTPTAPPPTEAT